MKPTIKTEWILCLIDGSYKQTSFQLQDLDNHFDAVGVLVDRAVYAGVLPKPRRLDKASGAQHFFGYAYEDGKHSTATRAPKAVCEWAGIGYWQLNHIQTMNDKGKSFTEIAAYIKENY